MAIDDDAFIPRLGKIRDRGAAGGARLRKRVATTAKHLARSGTRSKFTGKRLGRGKAAAMQADFGTRRYDAHRRRRVIVKTHIAKPGMVVGTGAFSKHIKYLQRDGVERDGSGGELYSREGKDVEVDAFTDRSKHDRHQFRFIVSPEDAHKLGDLKSYTRELMEVMERDLGTRLDWVAVDHHNTGHSHTHIVLRGKDAAGKDLIIAPDYWSRGLRQRASILATQRLGPRRTLEIMQQQRREVEQDRFTGLDRKLLQLEHGGEIIMTPATTTKDRFERDLKVQRLKHLQGLRLADKRSPSVWRLQPGWGAALKSMGQRGDIIKAIHAGLEPGQVPSTVSFFEERRIIAPPLLGMVHQQGPSDELKDTRYLLVRDFEGNIWHASAAALKNGLLPPKGAIVEVRKSKGDARSSDRTIAAIADRSGGYYSEEIHGRFDPSSSSAYRLAHKRRLEALRRAGIVERLSDGRWRVDENYLNRVRSYEARNAKTQIETRSWLTLEQQITAGGATWLDQIDQVEVERLIDTDLKTAKRQRVEHLRRRGLLSQDEVDLSAENLAKLKDTELKSAISKHAKRSGQAPVELSPGTIFEGVYEGTIDLGQGRFAIVAAKKRFTLVPWRREMEANRGREIVIAAHRKGISWNFPRGQSRGPSR